CGWESLRERNARPVCGRRHGPQGCRDLLSFPSDTVFGVFEDDALLEQFASYLIRFREVAGFLSCSARRDQRFDFSIRNTTGTDRRRQYGEKAVEPVEKRTRRSGVARMERTAVRRDVGFTN